MTSARYWRININGNAAGQYASMAECILANTIGGATQCGSGTPSADSYYPGQTPADACDGDPSTDWATGTGSPSGWWQYDFGVSTTVAEVRIMADVSPQYAPSAIDIQYSNDGSTFTTAVSYSNITWSSGNQVQSFPLSPPIGPLSTAQSPVEIVATAPNPQSRTQQHYVELIAQNIASVIGCFTVQNPVEIIAATNPPMHTQQHYVELIASTTILVPNNRLLLTDLTVNTTANYGSPSSVRLRYSDTRGATWDYTQTQTLGTGGDYDTDISFRQLGMSRDRVFEVSWTVPEPMVLTGCFVVVNKCKT